LKFCFYIIKTRFLPKVKCCLEYLVTNYKHYELVKKTPVFDIDNMASSTQATFIKRGHDARPWNGHELFEGALGGAAFHGPDISKKRGT